MKRMTFMDCVLTDVWKIFSQPVSGSEYNDGTSDSLLFRLQMKLVKLEGHMPTPGVDRDSEALPGAPGPMSASMGPTQAGYQLGSTARIQVSILQAIGLPASLSHFVFCQYQMWGQPEPTMAGPAFQPDSVKRTGAFGMLARPLIGLFTDSAFGRRIHKL